MAILGKTEGNGNVNDFTRGFATHSAHADAGEASSARRAQDVCLVMSGGTEGAMAPHWTVFERAEGDWHRPGARASAARTRRSSSPSSSAGSRRSTRLRTACRPRWRTPASPIAADVHFVQIKCPLLTAQRIADAETRGQTVATRDTLKSMGLSRAASSLGVAVALGEIAREKIADAAIGTDTSLWSGRASASAGIELMNHEIVVLGMSAAWCGPLAIDHAVMADAIDIEPVRAALGRLGLAAPPDSSRPSERERLVAVLAKAEASHDGLLRGHRHTMLDDSDISSTRHARAFVAGALAGLVGHAEIYVSGGAEHQGPDGGGPVAVIVRA